MIAAAAAPAAWTLRIVKTPIVAGGTLYVANGGSVDAVPLGAS